MVDMMRAKTMSNQWLRLFCCMLLPTAQWVLLTGCEPAPPGSPPPGGTNGGGGGVTAGDVRNLAGWWVVQRTSPSGQATWGNANVALNAAGDEASFNMDMDDGSSPILALHSPNGQEASGYWRTSWLDMPGLDTPANWQGSVSADAATISGTWSATDGQWVTTLHRAQVPDHTITGSWSRTDGATAVVACDGESMLLSVLDNAGNWVTDGFYDAAVTGSERLAGTTGGGFEGLLFAGRTRLHLQLSAGGGVLFDKSAGQSPLNGRWVGGDRRYRGDQPQRSVRIIVAVNSGLYVHDSWDFPHGLLRTFHATGAGANVYTDVAAGWSGQVAASGSRIVGEWTGWPGWYNSADRTVTPATNQLTGTWSSLSLDWAHHDSSGAIIRSHGTATLTQTGDRLQIADTDTAGNSYGVDATWVGDHYSGVWWDVNAPHQTSPWRGELLAGGNYLHGTWSNGEYSFGRFAILESGQVPATALGQPVYMADPYDDVLMTFSDAPSGIAGTVYCQQDRISSFSFVTAAGELQITVDDRARPVRIARPNQSLDFVWTDAATAEVTWTDNGVATTYTTTFDFSDAGVLQGIALAEQQTGRSLSGMRDWLAQNPGRILAAVQGTQPPPALARGIEPLALSMGKPTGIRLAQSTGENEFQQTRRQVVMMYFGTCLAAVAAVVTTAAPGISLALATAVAVGVGGLMVLATGAVFLFLWMLVEYCNPCSLQCFVNCQ